jgi:hypothetical protein
MVNIAPFDCAQGDCQEAVQKQNFRVALFFCFHAASFVQQDDFDGCVSILRVNMIT